MKVVRNCKNPEVVNLLLASLQQFPEEQRNEVLANVDNRNHNLALYFAANCIDLTELDQFRRLYPTHEAELAMLQHKNNPGETFAIALCLASNLEVIKSFLSRLKTFPPEERLEVLSACSSTGESVFATLKKQNDPALFAVFYECLEGMTDDQRRRCL
jgi:hypothetical protein